MNTIFPIHVDSSHRISFIVVFANYLIFFTLFAFVTGYKWNKRHLTYRFLSYTPDLPRNTVRHVFQQAFQVLTVLLRWWS